MVDDSWHLVDGTSDLSFEQSPRSTKSLRRQCVEKSSVGMNFTLFILQKNMPNNFLQLINLNINCYNKYLIVSNIARNSLQNFKLSGDIL